VLRLSFAGLPIEIHGVHPDAVSDLAPVYAQFSTSDPARLRVAIERVAGFGREPGPEYPAFRRRALADGRLHVERYDAEGEVTVGDLPLDAEFRVGPSANSLEACLRIAASLALPRDGALMFHGSAVVHDGVARVFIGVSGAGKSTISSLLEAVPGCTKIADELVVLRRTDAGWQVMVPPYLGPAGIAHGAQAPLAAVHVLVQAPFDRRDRLPAGEAVRELLRHVLVYVAEATTAERVLSLVAAVTTDTPCYRLHFRKDPHVATVLDLPPPTVH
jgi:hypothetical protein